MTSSFDSWSEIYDSIYSYVIEDIPFYVEAALASDGPVLELGCGTGRVSIPIAEAGVEIEFCPNFRGIRNVMATAYHPETKALYIPITPTCTKGMFSTVEQQLHPEAHCK